MLTADWIFCKCTKVESTVFKCIATTTHASNPSILSNSIRSKGLYTPDVLKNIFFYATVHSLIHTYLFVHSIKTPDLKHSDSLDKPD